jgi:FHA domain-containing protein
MPLVIRARSQLDASSSHAIVCTFDERGGTIGRADTSTLTLPDPARHVSRVQGVIVFHQGAYSIENVGRSNPVVLNGWPMRTGEASQLFHGDLLVVGQYVLTVDMSDGVSVPPTRTINHGAPHGEPLHPATPSAHAGAPEGAPVVASTPAANATTVNLDTRPSLDADATDPMVLGDLRPLGQHKKS